MPTPQADDLSALLAPPPGPALSVVQGFMTAWNAGTFANTVTVGTATFTNLPLISTVGMGANVLVLLLRSRNTYYILGKVTTP